MNAQSFHLVKKLHQASNPNSNFVVSPYSVALSLIMLYRATNGTSQAARQIVQSGWNISLENGERIDEYLDNLKHLPIEVIIPEFHIMYEDDLINELQLIGMQDMFQQGG
uniref:Serpin domain-containing protein n=1 Tax=Romanomermis culicivorax TaxID=13658 RepID=A0A915I1J0_ROMCU